MRDREETITFDLQYCRMRPRIAGDMPDQRLAAGHACLSWVDGAKADYGKLCNAFRCELRYLQIGTFQRGGESLLCIPECQGRERSELLRTGLACPTFREKAHGAPASRQIANTRLNLFVSAYRVSYVPVPQRDVLRMHGHGIAVGSHVLKISVSRKQRYTPSTPVKGTRVQGQRRGPQADESHVFWSKRRGKLVDMPRDSDCKAQVLGDAGPASHLTCGAIAIPPKRDGIGLVRSRVIHRHQV